VLHYMRAGFLFDFGFRGYATVSVANFSTFRVF
jgi:hypothetical protein